MEDTESDEKIQKNPQKSKSPKLRKAKKGKKAKKQHNFSKRIAGMPDPESNEDKEENMADNNSEQSDCHDTVVINTNEGQQIDQVEVKPTEEKLEETNVIENEIKVEDQQVEYQQNENADQIQEANEQSSEQQDKAELLHQDENIVDNEVITTNILEVVEQPIFSQPEEQHFSEKEKSEIQQNSATSEDDKSVMEQQKLQAEIAEIQQRELERRMKEEEQLKQIQQEEEQRQKEEEERKQKQIKLEIEMEKERERQRLLQAAEEERKQQQIKVSQEINQRLMQEQQQKQEQIRKQLEQQKEKEEENQRRIREYQKQQEEEKQRKLHEEQLKIEKQRILNEEKMKQQQKIKDEYEKMKQQEKQLFQQQQQLKLKQQEEKMKNNIERKQQQLEEAIESKQKEKDSDTINAELNKQLKETNYVPQLYRPLTYTAGQKTYYLQEESYQKNIDQIRLENVDLDIFLGLKHNNQQVSPFERKLAQIQQKQKSFKEQTVRAWETTDKSPIAQVNKQVAIQQQLAQNEAGNKKINYISILKEEKKRQEQIQATKQQYEQDLIPVNAQFIKNTQSPSRSSKPQQLNELKPLPTVPNLLDDKLVIKSAATKQRTCSKLQQKQQPQTSVIKQHSNLINFKKINALHSQYQGNMEQMYQYLQSQPSIYKVVSIDELNEEGELRDEEVH